MKKELFKVKNILSTTAIMGLLSISSFAQDADISKSKELDTPKAKTIKVSEKALKPKVTAIANGVKPIGIKELKITTENKEDMLEAEVKTISNLKSENTKNSTDKEELAAKQEKTTDQVEDTLTVEAKEKDLESESTLSREEFLENYICQKESQLEKLEEKFTSFQKSITQSTLAMQNAIAQISMLNQNPGSYQIYKVPTLTDRNSYLYPMMMMQSMQNRMMIQNMSSNYAQSMDRMMMAQIFASTQNMTMGMSRYNSSSTYNTMPNNQAMGQRQDAQTSNTQNLNNVQEMFNPNRTMAVTKDSQALQEQPWTQFTKASKAGYKFEADIADAKTGLKIETPKAKNNKEEIPNSDSVAANHSEVDSFGDKI